MSPRSPEVMLRIALAASAMNQLGRVWSREWHGTENMGPEPYRARKPEPHSVPYRQAQTVLRTVPLHLNRNPSRSVKFPSCKNVSWKIYYFVNVRYILNDEKYK